jgi:hypothetical protein
VARSGNDIRRLTGVPGWLLAVAAGGALGLAALGIRVAAGSDAQSAGPLNGQALLLAVPFAVGCAIAAAKYRTRIRYTTPTDAVADRLRTATLTLLVLGTAAVPLALLVLWHRSDGGGSRYNGAGPLPQLSLPPRTLVATPIPTQRPHTGAVHLHLALLLFIVGTALALVIVAVALRLIFRLGRTVQPAAVAGPAAPVAEAEDQALTDALLAARGALVGSDARAAIIACYHAMEISLAEAGIARHSSDTPTDLLSRADQGGVLAGGAPGELAALFREARFSTHPMGPSHLDRARAALDATTAHLAARQAEAAAQAADETPAAAR